MYPPAFGTLLPLIRHNTLRCDSRLFAEWDWKKEKKMNKTLSQLIVGWCDIVLVAVFRYEIPFFFCRSC